MFTLVASRLSYLVHPLPAQDFGGIALRRVWSIPTRSRVPGGVRVCRDGHAHGYRLRADAHALRGADVVLLKSERGRGVFRGAGVVLLKSERGRGLSKAVRM